MNLQTYVKDHDPKSLDFTNEIDALVLAQSVYFDFEQYLDESTKYPFLLGTLTPHEVDEKQISALKLNHHLLMVNMLTQPCFRNLEVIDFTYDFSPIEEKQFAAITYRLNDQLFIAYRGTDATVLGWKEDFNMSFEKDVPSQRSSVHYLDRIAKRTSEDLYIGGHSKGGNLAVYASAFCLPRNQRRVKRVFNYDGPGFHSDIIASMGYLQILARTTKYIPGSSMIGKLLLTLEIEEIVQSNQVSIFQHSAYTWQIEANHFKTRKDTSISSKKFTRSIQRWLEMMDVKQRKFIIDQFYQGFCDLGIERFEDLQNLKSLEGLQSVWELVSQSDPQLRENLKEITKQFALALIKSN